MHNLECKLNSHTKAINLQKKYDEDMFCRFIVKQHASNGCFEKALATYNLQIAELDLSGRYGLFLDEYSKVYKCNILGFKLLFKNSPFGV